MLAAEAKSKGRNRGRNAPPPVSIVSLLCSPRAAASTSPTAQKRGGGRRDGLAGGGGAGGLGSDADLEVDVAGVLAAVDERDSPCRGSFV